MGDGGPAADPRGTSDRATDQGNKGGQPPGAQRGAAAKLSWLAGHKELASHFKDPGDYAKLKARVASTFLGSTTARGIIKQLARVRVEFYWRSSDIPLRYRPDPSFAAESLGSHEGDRAFVVVSKKRLVQQPTIRAGATRRLSHSHIYEPRGVKEIADTVFHEVLHIWWRKQSDRMGHPTGHAKYYDLRRWDVRQMAPLFARKWHAFQRDIQFLAPAWRVNRRRPADIGH